tara:strand:- start:15891 stop:17006 length:1116 start_codon:yes stop_codon:yes gene_type:complete
MKEKNIQLMKPNVGEDELELLREVIESGYLVQGPMVNEFEEAIKSYMGVKHAITCTSWTSGAELVFRAIEIKEGDEVICPDFSHPATALAVITAGGVPVFVDVDLDSRNTTAALFEEAITENTKSLQPVSIFGNPVDIDPINDIAQKNNLVVIDDAACTLGSHYKGKPVGGLTDFTIFSFHPRKVFTCGDGGLITTNDDKWSRILKSMKVFGAEDGEFKNWGTNQRMSNIHGAVLLGQARRIDSIVQERIDRAKKYDKLLAGLDNIHIPKIDSQNRSNYQTYAILLDFETSSLDEIRSKIMKRMREKGIQTQIGTYSISSTPYLSKYRIVGKLENSKRLASGLLSLPLHHELDDKDLQYVAECLEESILSL